MIATAATLLLVPAITTTSAQAASNNDGSNLVITVNGKSNATSKETYQNSTNTSDIIQNEHFDKNNISYYITPGVASGVQKDIRAAALQWNISTKVNLYETKNKNNADIVFTNKGTSSVENGLTTNTVNRSRGYTEVLSSSIDLSKSTIPQGNLSVMGRRVAEHELGHALGLKDTKTDQNGTIMWYKTPNTDITAKDIAAINLYYK